MSVLSRMNGWQRIWLVLTGLGLLVSVGVSLKEANKYEPYMLDIDSDLFQDLRNPACAKYNTEPLTALVEPPFSTIANCRELYRERKYHPEMNLPITMEAHYARISHEKFLNFLAMSAVGTVATLFLSALAYLSGKIVAWIIRGFRKPDQA